MKIAGIIIMISGGMLILAGMVKTDDICIIKGLLFCVLGKLFVEEK